MKHARIAAGRVIGVIEPQFYADGPFAGVQIPLSELFHPDFVAGLVECPDDTQDGYLYDGATFSRPPVPPEPTKAELISLAQAETRIQRQPIIEVLDGLQASALAKSDPARALSIETAKQGLRDITDTDLSTCITYEDMRLKVKAAYIALAKALPLDVRLAFSEALK